MSINKFGASIGEVSNDTSSGFVRNFVRNNALCIASNNDFDAKSCKIQRLAAPTDDTDAANKCYVRRITDDKVEAKYKEICEIISREVGDAAKEFESKIDAFSKKLEDVSEKLFLDIKNVVNLYASIMERNDKKSITEQRQQ